MKNIVSDYMDILQVDNICSIPWNIKKGLERKGHKCDIVFKPSKFGDGEPTEELLDHYDVVHLHYPYHYWKLKYARLGDKLVLHWHGSDARKKYRRWALKKYLRMKADSTFYSTPDISCWIPEGELMYGPIDLEKFKPLKKTEASKTMDHKKGYSIARKDMPSYLGHLKEFEQLNIERISPYLLSISQMEALACGCKVKCHEDKDRKWVKKHCSIEAAACQALEVYEK